VNTTCLISAPHHVPSQGIHRRPDEARGLPDHVIERRSGKVDVLAGVNLGLAVRFDYMLRHA
jgi:hypothetical protein